jgi:tetratricopeptide (TPR) repeat protein
VLGIEGWFALGTRDYATAVKTLTAAAEKVPNTETTILIARALWAQQKQDEAITLMQNWLKDRPQDLEVLLQLAESYLALNREADAVGVYKRIVELYPNHVPTLNNLAWLNRDKGLKEAIDYAERANKLAPYDPYVLDTYGMLLLKKGELSKGSRMLQNATERSPDDLTLQVHLAGALVQQKQFAEARKILDAVVKKAPDSQAANEAKALLESIR